MLLVDDLAAGGTKNLRHTPRGLVTLSLDGRFITIKYCFLYNNRFFFTKNSLVPIYAQVIYLHVFWGKAICLFFMPIKYQYCNVRSSPKNNQILLPFSNCYLLIIFRAFGLALILPFC